MATYQQYKQQVLQLFERAIPLAVHYRYPDTQKHLEEAKKHLEEGKLFVVVCGEFRQGKSSLLNALLNEQNLFPVALDIFTTNLVSTITYGKEETITIVLEEKGKEAVKQIQRQEIADYVTEQGNVGNVKKAKMLVIQSPNPQLKEGLVLVDTPGIGSINKEHTAITYAFIPNADAILFVTDVLKPLTTEEIEFLKQRILPHCQKIIFVLTKIDAVNVEDAQKILENDRQKLAEVLDCSAEMIPIIPVSSRAKLDYLKYEEPQDLEHSKFAELEKRIWQLASQERGAILLLRALSELNRSTNEMKTPIQVAWEANQERTKEELDALEEQLKETEQKLQGLLENNADWKTLLLDGLQDLRTQIMEMTEDNFVAINQQAKLYIDDPSLLENPEQIVSLLEVDIDAMMTKLGQQISNLAAILQGKLELSTGLELNSMEINTLGAVDKERFSLEELKRQKPGIWDNVLQVTRNAAFNMTAAGTIGGVAGGTIGSFFGGIGAVPGYAIGAAIGTALTGLVGLVTGAKQGLSQIKERNKQAVSIAIKQFISESQKHWTRKLNKAVKDLERSMRDEFTNQIKRQQEGWKRTLKSLQESRKLSQAEAAKRSQELQIPLQQLTQLQDNIAQIAQAIAEQSFSTTSPSSQPPKPPTQKPPQQKVTVTTDTNADYGDWADE